jgi:hypothetical protein
MKKQRGSTRIWKDVVSDALTKLGGQAHISEITQIALQDPKAAANQHVAKKVQQTVRAYSVFESIQEGSGIYRFADAISMPPPTSPDLTAVLPASTFTIKPSVTDEIQGMLLSIGKIYGYGVYAPANDRTMRNFNGQPLSALTDIATDLKPIVGATKSAVVQRIDVLWFDEDEIDVFPVYGFEIEHTTLIHTGLNRLAEIPRRFNSRLFIVGDDAKDQTLFNNLLAQNVYKPLKSRFAFQTFEDVRNLYQAATAFEKARSDNQQAMLSFGVDAV